MGDLQDKKFQESREFQESRKSPCDRIYIDDCLVLRREISKLIDDLKNMQEKLKSKQEQLAKIEDRCTHKNWTPARRDDLTPDIKRWKRECALCGKKEYTFQTREIIIQEPYFPQGD